MGQQRIVAYKQEFLCTKEFRKHIRKAITLTYLLTVCWHNSSNEKLSDNGARSCIRLKSIAYSSGNQSFINKSNMKFFLDLINLLAPVLTVPWAKRFWEILGNKT